MDRNETDGLKFILLMNQISWCCHKNVGIKWVNNLMILMKHPSLTFMIHCYMQWNPIFASQKLGAGRRDFRRPKGTSFRRTSLLNLRGVDVSKGLI